jgi:hypothetical protein
MRTPRIHQIPCRSAIAMSRRLGNRHDDHACKQAAGAILASKYTAPSCSRLCESLLPNAHQCHRRQS